MKISDILSSGKPSLSFEVFPPKTEANFESVANAVKEICTLDPSFMSVTYGAGGGTSQHTVSIASTIQNQYQVTALAHLTCISSTKEMVEKQLAQLEKEGIENILALRGDMPEGMSTDHLDYQHASDLASQIASSGKFCIGGACYPEGHPESDNSRVDIDNLKKKVDAGCQFLTTQMFFDNTILYNYLYKIREKGITVPVVAGIMPVTKGKQIARICKLSSSVLPPRFKAIVDKWGDNDDAMTQAGIAYATDQIIDLLANGINGIHVYSMNNPYVASEIKKNLSYLLS